MASSMPCLKCLKELSLSQVRFDSKCCGGDRIWSILSKFVLLERLSIENPQCWGHKLRLHDIDQLKHLNISNFSKDISSLSVYHMKNLASLRCHGLEFYILHVENVPKLVDFTTVSTHSERDGKVVIPNVHDSIYPRPTHVRLSIRLDRRTVRASNRYNINVLLCFG